MKILFAVIRVVVAALIVAAIVAQLQKSASVWASQGLKNIGFQYVNFFSFFTIDSNVLSVVVLLIGAIYVFARRDDPAWYNLFRVIVVTYMATTGIVYNLLLRGIELPQGTTVAWSNEVLHVVGPAYLIIDWFFAPGRKPLEWNKIWAIVVFPVVWGVYTLVRGPFAIQEINGKPWYPYPFLNPTTSNEGYFSVAFYIVLIAAVIAGFGALAIWYARKRAGVRLVSAG